MIANVDFQSSISVSLLIRRGTSKLFISASSPVYYVVFVVQTLGVSEQNGPLSARKTYRFVATFPAVTSALHANAVTALLHISQLGNVHTRR